MMYIFQFCNADLILCSSACLLDDNRTIKSYVPLFILTVWCVFAEEVEYCVCAGIGMGMEGFVCASGREEYENASERGTVSVGVCVCARS